MCINTSIYSYNLYLFNILGNIHQTILSYFHFSFLFLGLCGRGDEGRGAVASISYVGVGVSRAVAVPIRGRREVPVVSWRGFDFEIFLGEGETRDFILEKEKGGGEEGRREPGRGEFRMERDSSFSFFIPMYQTHPH